MFIQTSSLRRPLVALYLLVVTTLAFSMQDVRADVGVVELTPSYATSGQTLTGKVALDNQGTFPKDARLRITVFRQVDVPANPKDPVEVQPQVVFDKPLSDFPAPAQIPFQIDTTSLLTGVIQAKAEIVVADQAAPIGLAWSSSIEVGVRPRVSLAGPWPVTDSKPMMELEPHKPPKTWKPPTFDKPVMLPGPLTSDRSFRGVVTLQRKIDWSLPASYQPRFIHLAGVADSVLVKIDGVALGETLPVSDLDELSHWQEFHSSFKGDENKDKRLMTSDLEVLPPISMALPKPLASTGNTNIELVVRGTSGATRPKPVYGIHAEPYLEATPNVFINDVSFDTEKTSEKRRFKFQLALGNQSGVEFKGVIRTTYGRYTGDTVYTGPCLPYAVADQQVTLAPGQTAIEVDRDELPRFETCRATFVLLDAQGRVLDAMAQDFHAVTVEIRDRRDIYVNNERFIYKFQGSNGDDPNSRFAMLISGVNGFRGNSTIPSLQYPGLWSTSDSLNVRFRDGLLTDTGLVASCERCVFWNPKDKSNITKVVKASVRSLYQCPGLIDWEATNELYGEPDAARVALLDAYHKLDPYHRPVVATKGSGEWESLAHDGRVDGVDIVGCQYLLTTEGIDSITAAITQQPLMCTEVNFNDTMLLEHKIFESWLNKGLAGVLLFDYSGKASDAPVPLIPPKDDDKNVGPILYRTTNRQMLQDVVSSATALNDGTVRLTFANRMPYTLHGLSLKVQGFGQFSLPDLAPGDGASVFIPETKAPPVLQPVVARLEYTTHAGLRHIAILTPIVGAETKTENSK